MISNCILIFFFLQVSLNIGKKRKKDTIVKMENICGSSLTTSQYLLMESNPHQYIQEYFYGMGLIQPQICYPMGLLPGISPTLGTGPLEPCRNWSFYPPSLFRQRLSIDTKSSISSPNHCVTGTPTSKLW